MIIKQNFGNKRINYIIIGECWSILGVKYSATELLNWEVENEYFLKHVNKL